MSTVTVYKLDENGREVWQYPATLIERRDGAVKLEAYFNRDDMDLGYTIFKRGDRFVEHFYKDRWYNIFAIYDRDDGKLKGWYCNICRPAEITASSVRCEDLALDLWVSPDGAAQVLDEDEYARSQLAPREREQGYQALHELQRLAAQDQLPR